MIDSIHIENFKSIRTLDLNLKPINVLIGANGTGKSNFIGFFKLLNVLYKGELQNYVATHGKADSFLYLGRKRSSLFGKIVFYTKQDSIPLNSYRFKLVPTDQSNLIIEFEESGYSKDGGITWDYSFVNPLDYNSKILTTNSYSVDKDIRKHFKTFQIYHFHDTSRTAPLRTPCSLNDNRTLREDGSNLAAFLYWMEKQHPKNFQFITRTIHSIAPFFKGFSLEPDKLAPDSIELVWEEIGSDMYLNAHSLSDGTLRFMALATLLLQPEPPSTIIIDEPELGLHPFALNKLAGLIKKASAKSQIIISTQSVNLVSNFEPENIITVDREDGQSVFRRLETEPLKDWLEDYSLGDLWTKSVIKGQP